MESPSESNQKSSLWKQPIVQTLSVGILLILGIVLFFLVTRGSQFCFLSSCSQSTNSNLSQHIPLGQMGVAATAAVVLVTVLDMPIITAIGLSIVIGLIAG